MAVTVPNLDDRRFQDLVDDAKRLVQKRCPEWTDHNVSDPGVTLIETMAYLVDTLLYRLNRVPDKLYLTFLDLIGMQPHAPVAARADVTFWLTAPQPDPVTVPAATRVGTVRTDHDDAVEFETVEHLDIPPRCLAGVATQQAGQEVLPRTSELRERAAFLAFAEQPNMGDALLVGLDDSAPRCAVALRWDCVVQGIGVNPDYPPLRWEAWNGRGWTLCDTEVDGTGGLNRPGDIVVHLPATHSPSVIGGVRAGWLRTVVTAPVPGYPAYVASPLVRSVEAFTVGATATCVHAETVEGEVLGLSEGVAGQRFPLAKAPVVRDVPMVLEVASG
ncbi:MAG: putative baseplate assembly protein, partial [Dermatophilaceae bacterium]